MIRFVLKREHRYTVAPLCDGGYDLPIPGCSVLAYEDLFLTERLSPATYIFCDIERLSDLELVVAAEVARTMKDAPGFRVLNDPATVKTRYALLRSLREAGINLFDAYPAQALPRPARFPVFVRAEAAHDKPLTELLADQTALDAALDRLPLEGTPLRGLLVIEFCAEPFREVVWRRYGTFRLGDAISLDHVVSDKHWNVKYGAPGLVDEEVYAADHEEVVANAWADELRQAFAIAGIDYGRADFGIVDGKPQIYEINTNPGLSKFEPHPSASRSASLAFSQKRFVERLFALDVDGSGNDVRFDGPRMRHERWVPEDAREWAKAKARKKPRRWRKLARWWPRGKA